MYHQHHGYTDGEFLVLCFMAAGFHCQITAETSTNTGNSQERGFRDSPEIVLCIVFINKHKHKGKRIYYYQVEYDNIHKSSFPEVVTMKKLCFLLVCVLLLAGCQAAPTFETMEDVYAPQPQSTPRQVALDLPEDVQTIVGDSGKLYLCDGYDITVETFVSGDLNSTVQLLTGFAPDALTMMETAVSDARRYECVWTAAGENGDTVGRAVVLDDGQYHYCVTVMSNADTAGDLTGVWQELLNSVHLK